MRTAGAPAKGPVRSISDPDPALGESDSSTLGLAVVPSRFNVGQRSGSRPQMDAGSGVGMVESEGV
jgi:hypothetical protein